MYEKLTMNFLNFDKTKLFIIQPIQQIKLSNSTTNERPLWSGACLCLNTYANYYLKLIFT